MYLLFSPTLASYPTLLILLYCINVIIVRFKVQLMMLIMLFSLSAIVSSVSVKNIPLSTLLWNVLNLYFSQDVTTCFAATNVPSQNISHRIIHLFMIEWFQLINCVYRNFHKKKPSRTYGISVLRNKFQYCLNCATWESKPSCCQSVNLVRTLLILMSDFRPNMLPMACQIAISLLQN
jgi:hypothetical protein